jgi:hypothetical protein
MVLKTTMTRGIMMSLAPLGHAMLVKLKIDDLLEQEHLSAPMREDGYAPNMMAATSGTH